MFRTHTIPRAIGLCILFFCFAVLLTGCTGSSTDTSAALQPDGARIAKGKVIAVTPEAITIKPPRGVAILVKLTADTRYTGVAAGQIKKGQALEIRYKTEGTENTAISVTAIKEGSC